MSEERNSGRDRGQGTGTGSARAETDETNLGGEGAKAPERIDEGNAAPADDKARAAGLAPGTQDMSTSEERTDGPTLQEFLDAGYKAENYPPTGYAPREEPPVAASGFAPLRHWCNRLIRKLPEGVPFVYANEDWRITEITPEGQIRLQHEKGNAVLIPLDERYIPRLFGDLLERERQRA